MKLLEEEGRIPNISEVCVLPIKNIERLGITTAIDGEISTNNWYSITEDNILEKAEKYKKQYSDEFELYLSEEELNRDDSISSYRIIDDRIENNDTDLITLVEYLGEGRFRDVLSGIEIRAVSDEYTDGMANEYSVDESRNICESFYHDVANDNTSRNLIERINSYINTPLIIRLETADLCSIDGDGMRKFLSQSQNELIRYMNNLNSKAKVDLEKQIDLLPIMDEHLAHAENEFRGRFR